MTTRLTLCFALWFVCVGCSRKQASAPRAQDRCRAIAERWLALLDTGAHEQAYAQLAVRPNVDEKAWRRSMSQSREPLGKVLGRRLLDLKVRTALGETQVLVRFDTRFVKAKTTLERVSCRVWGDRAGVVGYHLR